LHEEKPDHMVNSVRAHAAKEMGAHAAKEMGAGHGVGGFEAMT